MEEAAQQEAVKAAMRREWEQAFDLARGPVLRVKLLQAGRAGARVAADDASHCVGRVVGGRVQSGVGGAV